MWVCVPPTCLGSSAAALCALGLGGIPHGPIENVMPREGFNAVWALVI